MAASQTRSDDESPFDYSTATPDERDPCGAERAVARNLQQIDDIEVVGWSGTRECIALTGTHDVLKHIITASKAAGCEPDIRSAERASGLTRVTFEAIETLEQMAN